MHSIRWRWIAHAYVMTVHHHLSSLSEHPGFGWQSWEGKHWWRTLRAQVPELARMGVTHLWLPPPSASVSPQGYLPSQLFDLNSNYGTAQELRELCRDLLAAGIRWAGPCPSLVLAGGVQTASLRDAGCS